MATRAEATGHPTPHERAEKAERVVPDPVKMAPQTAEKGEVEASKAETAHPSERQELTVIGESDTDSNADAASGVPLYRGYDPNAPNVDYCEHCVRAWNEDRAHEAEVMKKLQDRASEQAKESNDQLLTDVNLVMRQPEDRGGKRKEGSRRGDRAKKVKTLDE